MKIESPKSIQFFILKIHHFGNRRTYFDLMLLSYRGYFNPGRLIQKNYARKLFSSKSQTF